MAGLGPAIHVLVAAKTCMPPELGHARVLHYRAAIVGHTRLSQREHDGVNGFGMTNKTTIAAAAGAISGPAVMFSPSRCARNRTRGRLSRDGLAALLLMDVLNAPFSRTFNASS
jgi:hypothetical protein